MQQVKIERHMSPKLAVGREYLPPFHLVQEAIIKRGEGATATATLPLGLFEKLLRAYAVICGFDSEFYLRSNPDVSRAIKEGVIADALDHFVRSGYFEGRLGVKFDVDSDWYLERYPDVAKGLGNGLVVSADRHFNQTGYQEGRVSSSEMAKAAESWRPYLRGAAW